MTRTSAAWSRTSASTTAPSPPPRSPRCTLSADVFARPPAAQYSRRPRPRDPGRRGQGAPRVGEQLAAARAEVVLAIAGGDAALGVLHQAAAVGAVLEAERVPGLVNGDLAQTLARVRGAA